jgi:hypothetical protein
MDANVMLILIGCGLTGFMLLLLGLHVREEKKLLELLESDYHKGKQH